MRIYGGLGRYTKEDLERICGNSRVQGIVLGDLFCQKRMFPSGFLGLADGIRYAHSCGKRVVYQPPLYATSKNMEEIDTILSLMEEERKDGVVLTGDIGLAALVRQKYASLSLCWNRMGRSREYSYNPAFFSFLKENQITCFETDKEETAQKLLQAGIEPWLVYGNLYYRTMGRICYCQYELGLDSFDCQEVCNTGGYSLRAEDGSFRMSMDGYLLGEELRYSEYVRKQIQEGQVGTAVVYARTAKELERRLMEAAGA